MNIIMLQKGDTRWMIKRIEDGDELPEVETRFPKTDDSECVYAYFQASNPNHSVQMLI